MSGGDGSANGGDGAPADGMAGAVVEARARVAAGHQAVAAGRYREAFEAFRGALATLSGALGDEDPEVVELRLDLRTVVEMDQVSALGRTLDPTWDSPVDRLVASPPRR